MNYSLNIINWFALAPGLSSPQQWQRWASEAKDSVSGDIEKYQKIPMMAARRMSVPTRLAVESGLRLLEQDKADAAVFVSRHGELERTYKIITSLAEKTDISPTDFAMSVHNTAAGLLTITAKDALPITSLAAGKDGFQQGMLEAQAVLKSGARRVLFIDFDGLVPETYREAMDDEAPNFAYALGFMVSAGQQIHCRQTQSAELAVNGLLPQSLLFLKCWLNKEKQFVINGIRTDWQWTI